MSETIRIVTPEQVELDYEVAGLGSRLLAGLLDALLQAGLIFAGFIVALILGAGAAITGRAGQLDLITSTVIALWALYLFLVLWGYFIYFEVRWNGQTPGKRTLGLRVIRESGHPLDFRAALVRNIVRIVDMLPGVYAVAIITMFVSEHWRRLGDHAAGTIIVKERREPDAMSPRSAPVLWDSRLFSMLNDHALGRISMLTRAEYEIARRFLERRAELDFSTAGRLAREIAYPLLTHLGVTLPFNTPDRDYETFLEAVVQAYERTHGR